LSYSAAQLLVYRPDGTRRPRAERISILRQFTDEQLERLKRDWKFWARPEQLEPDGLWTLWAMITGRGFGKTRSGGEWVLDRSEAFARHSARHLVLLVGTTVADCRDVMVEGESGIMACAERRGYTAKYEPSKRRVTIPDLDTTMTTFTAEKPDQLRGPQGHTAWADEPAKWKHIVDREGNSAWSNLMLALRLEGDIPFDWLEGYEDDDDLPDFEAAPVDLQPQCVATTTPKPIPLVRDWVARAKLSDVSIHLTTGSMMENADNLAPRFIAEIQARYGGTRLAAQEIDGVLLEAVEGALWEPDLIERWRVRRPEDVPSIGRKVIGVDPSGSGHGHGDDCGIIIVGVEANPVDFLRRHTYVLDDLTSDQRPSVWAKIVVDAYWREGCDAIVVETNFGAALVVDVVRQVDPNVVIEEVRASKGKRVRAEPVAMLYDQGRTHHVGTHALLESEQCTWVPDEDMDSPNRMDALVWAHHFLLPEIARPPASTWSPAEERIPTGAEAMIPGSGGGLDSMPAGWPGT
jgi:phage terminase large subunit-like protein